MGLEAGKKSRGPMQMAGWGKKWWPKRGWEARRDVEARSGREAGKKRVRQHDVGGREEWRPNGGGRPGGHCRAAPTRASSPAPHLHAAMPARGLHRRPGCPPLVLCPHSSTP